MEKLYVSVPAIPANLLPDGSETVPLVILTKYSVPDFKLFVGLILMVSVPRNSTCSLFSTSISSNNSLVVNSEILIFPVPLTTSSLKVIEILAEVTIPLVLSAGLVKITYGASRSLIGTKGVSSGSSGPSGSSGSGRGPGSVGTCGSKLGQ